MKRKYHPARAPLLYTKQIDSVNDYGGIWRHQRDIDPIVMATLDIEREYREQKDLSKEQRELMLTSLDNLRTKIIDDKMPREEYARYHDALKHGSLSQLLYKRLIPNNNIIYF